MKPNFDLETILSVDFDLKVIFSDYTSPGNIIE